eukprot:21541-Heterococcus_DN1.PRE.2
MAHLEAVTLVAVRVCQCGTHRHCSTTHCCYSGRKSIELCLEVLAYTAPVAALSYVELSVPVQLSTAFAEKCSATVRTHHMSR